MTRPSNPLTALAGLALIGVIANRTFWIDAEDGLLGVCAVTGFAIARDLLETAGTPGWVGSYYRRHIRRTWPLYFILASLMALTAPSSWAGQQVPPWSALTFSANIFTHATPRRLQEQSLLRLCLWEQVCLALPLIFLFRRSRTVPMSLALITAACALVQGWLVDPRADELALTFGQVEAMALGALAGWVAVCRPRWTSFAPPLGLIMLGFALLRAHEMPVWMVLVSSIIAAFVILTVTSGLSPPLTRLCDSTPMRVFGRLSYALYLLHPLVFDQLRQFTSALGPPLFAEVMVPAVALAYAWHRYGEPPILARLQGEREARTAPQR